MWVFAWIAVAFACASIAPCALAAEPASSTERPTIMRLISEQWLRSQSADASLPYGYDFLADKATGPAGNPWAQAVRQAGSFYMWALYYGYSGDRRLQEPLRRALTALGARSLPIGKSRAQAWLEATRILSLPVARWKLNHALDRFGLLYESAGPGKVVSADGRYASAYTGGAALALLAELAYSDAAGDERFSALRAAWYRGLLALRIPGAGFRQAPDSIEESDYANGEAWLAIAVYCERDPQSECQRALADLDGVMLARYTARPSFQFYHWGAMVAAQRYGTTRDPRFIAFLQQQARYFLGGVRARLNADENNCGEMEGVSATLAAFKRAGDGTGTLAVRLREWLAVEAEKLPKLQIQPDQTRLRLGGEARLTAPRLAAFSGAFLLGVYAPETRVDAAAHCLSALMMIERDRVLQTAG